MNLYDAENMKGPSVSNIDGMCVVCGMRPATDKHHVVFRSRGGGDGPLLSLCRECHELAHQYRLHFRFRMDDWNVPTKPYDCPGGYEVSLSRTGHWEWLLCDAPTKYADALKQGGWHALRHRRMDFGC